MSCIVPSSRFRSWLLNLIALAELTSHHSHHSNPSQCPDHQTLKMWRSKRGLKTISLWQAWHNLFASAAVYCSRPSGDKAGCRKALWSGDQALLQLHIRIYIYNYMYYIYITICIVYINLYIILYPWNERKERRTENMWPSWCFMSLHASTISGAEWQRKRNCARQSCSLPALPVNDTWGHLDKWRKATTNHSELEEKSRTAHEDKGDNSNTFRFWYVLLVSCLIGRLHPEPVSSRSFSSVKHWSKTSLDMFWLQVVFINLPQDTNTQTKHTILIVSLNDLLSRPQSPLAGSASELQPLWWF